MEQSNKMVWEYQGKQFPNKKAVRDYYGWSTCKFDIKAKENKIIKINQEATAYETTTITN